MDDKIICKKVSSMLSVYIDNKISDCERAFIEEHLANCENCYKKYTYLKSLIKSLKDSYKRILELSIKKQKRKTFCIKEHEYFLENLSPYIDNELDAKDCYEFRKHLLKSKTAQNELKKTYLMQKEMRHAFNRIRKKTSFGISTRVMNSLKKTNDNSYENKFLHNFFNIKTTQIAFFLSLILICSYGVTSIDIKTKPKIKQVVENETFLKEDIYKSHNEKNDFVEF